MTPFALLLAQVMAAAQVDSAVSEGIRRGIYPGAVVVVGTTDTILLRKGYGHFTWSAESRSPDPDSTLYDLASLTKVIATTPAVMRLVDEGRLGLDWRIQTYLPEFRGEGKHQVTLRHLLEHRSGLRAFLPLNKLTSSDTAARQRVLEEPLRWAPESRVVYSDLNAMLLGWIVERVSGLPLDSFVTTEVLRPIGMRQTQFAPSRSLRNRIAPVGLWRGHVVAGQLHDQNAVRLGGVSGHAGLYGTGADLARFARLLLRRGRLPDGRRLFSEETVQAFTRRGLGNRALGWEMNDTTSTDNTGAFLSADAYGHGGYTGTSIWIDPRLELFVVILTNRVFAPRTRRSISQLKEVRARVADAGVRLRHEACEASRSAQGAQERCR